MLEKIEVNPDKKPTSSVIWLHGLGADGHDFAPIVPELKLAENLATRFVFPHAPVMPVTLNGGMSMRAWFDITGLELDSRYDEHGVIAAQASIHELIEHEMSLGISNEKIILAGFSLGGALALVAGLCSPIKLAGILAMSTYLPHTSQLSEKATEENKRTPIFFAHGTNDPVIPLANAQASQQQLIDAGYQVDWRTYPMPHSVCPEELIDIGQWISSVLN